MQKAITRNFVCPTIFLEYTIDVSFLILFLLLEAFGTDLGIRPLENTTDEWENLTHTRAYTDWLIILNKFRVNRDFFFV